MTNKEKKHKIGCWAKLYVEELLRGGYVHNPTIYVESKYRKHYLWHMRKYCVSWSNALNALRQRRYKIVEIPNHYGGNWIYILKKNFPKFIKDRIIEKENGFIMCRVIDRNLLFRPGKFLKEFEVYSCRKTIKQILTDEVVYRMDSLGDDSSMTAAQAKKRYLEQNRPKIRI
jgi:hypothetical protein